MGTERSIQPFELHLRLAADCHTLGEVAEGLVLLHKNASLPWLIFVPRTDVGQLHELEAEERLRVQNRWNELATWVDARFDCDRVNVAAIGNMVPHMPLHVVGRRMDDAVWPNVPWGQWLPEKTWSEEELEDFRADLGLTAE